MSNNKNKKQNQNRTFSVNGLSSIKQDSYYNIINHIEKNKNLIGIYLLNPERYQKEIRDISIYLSNNSSHYLRLVYYLSSMLTLDYYLYPTEVDKFDKTKINDLYSKAQFFLDRFKIKNVLSKIIPILIVEDVYYGFLSRSKNSIDIIQLPNGYCETIGTSNGRYIFSFDFSYFDSNNYLLSTFPQEFTNLYNKYRRTNKAKQILSSKNSVCFKMREDLLFNLPILAPLFAEILELERKKDIADQRELLNNYKLLIQRIPLKNNATSERDMLFQPETAGKFHNNVKNIVPSGVGVVTTPMDIEPISLVSKSNIDELNLPDAQEMLFSSGGFGNIFNSKNKTEKSFTLANISDQSLMFKLLRQFENFFNDLIRQELNNKNIKISFPDLTYYNRKEKTEEYLKLAQFGYPKTLVAISSGISQKEFMGLNKLEEVLDLGSKLVPLSSSHTQTTNTTNDVGRPTEEDNNT